MTEENTNTDYKDTKAKKEKDEIQVTVSVECEEKLQQMLDRVNSSFEFGKVTRKQLLAHVIGRALINFNDDEIQGVRRSATTDIMLLERLYREAKESGVVPAALKDYLWGSSDMTQVPKRTKKSGQAKYSNAIYEESEAA